MLRITTPGCASTHDRPGGRVRIRTTPRIGATSMLRRKMISPIGNVAEAIFIMVSLTTKVAMAASMAAMPRRLSDGSWAGTAMLTSAAGYAHMAGNSRLPGAAVDDEVVSLGLAGDRLIDRGHEQRIVFTCAQGAAQ